MSSYKLDFTSCAIKDSFHKSSYILVMYYKCIHSHAARYTYIATYIKCLVEESLANIYIVALNTSCYKNAKSCGTLFLSEFTYRQFL